MTSPATFRLSLSAQCGYVFGWFSARSPRSYSGIMTESSIRAGAGTNSANGRLIEEMFTAIDTRDWPTLAAFFHPDLVYERPGYDPFVGRDRVLRFYRDERMISWGNHTLFGTVAEPGAAAAWGRIDAMHNDGTPIELGFADIYLFEEGAIKLRRSHFFVPAV